MKLSIVAGFVFVLLVMSTDTTHAGLLIGDNEISLEPFQKGTICVGVWTGAPGTTHHEVRVSENLEPYISSISITEFDIYEVDCPQDPVERRKCIKAYCDADNTHFCRQVCIEFSGPFYTSFDTSEQVIEGHIQDIGYYLASQTVIPQKITVRYRPFNLLIIVLSVAVVAVLVLMVLYFKYFNKPSYVQSPEPCPVSTPQYS